MRHTVISGLDSSNYTRHLLHTDASVWTEKNCYADLWIELLHALRLNPLAMLPFTITIDFEGDQWTFFKPSHDELYELYGVDVQELTIWQPLLEHAKEQLSAGKLVSTEADAFWLPDTAGTDYRDKHTKTTIVLNDLDVENRRLSYFHNAGYYTLEGDDFVKTFRLDAPEDPAFMPLYCEFVRIKRTRETPEKELAAQSWGLLRKHFGRISDTNPMPRFRDRFNTDLPLMQARGLQFYHAWAFAATRQLGAAFELAAFNLRWLEAHGFSGLESSALAFIDISNACKAFILKGARAVNSKKPYDASAMFAELESAWSRGMEGIARHIRV